MRPLGDDLFFLPYIRELRQHSERDFLSAVVAKERTFFVYNEEEGARGDTILIITTCTMGWKKEEGGGGGGGSDDDDVAAGDEFVSNARRNVFGTSPVRAFRRTKAAEGGIEVCEQVTNSARIEQRQKGCKKE